MTIEIKDLPFVDGIPKENQKRLEYIVNGERLYGADTEYGNEGNLNRVQRQLQVNIETLSENDKAIQSVLDDQGKNIDHILSLFDESSDETLIEQVSKNTDDIKDLQLEDEKLNDRIDTFTTSTDSLRDDLGTKPNNGDNKNVYQVLDFIKTEVGNEPGFDINGMPDEDNPSSGLIKKLADVTTEVLRNTSDIAELGQKLIDTDIVELDNSINKIENDLGDKPDDSRTIYSRLEESENSIQTNINQLATIEESIGTTPVAPRLTKLETSVGAIEDVVDELETTTSNTEKNVEDNTTDIEELQTTTESLSTTLGTTTDDVAQLKLTVGTESDQASVLGRLKIVEDKQSTASANIQDINLALNEVSASVTPLTKAVNGDATKTDAVEKAGLMASTKTLYTNAISTNTAIESLVGKYNYNQKTFALLSDKSLNDTSGLVATIASKLNAVNSEKSIFSTGGINAISDNNNFSDAIKSGVVLINCSTFDYLNNTTLGEIADASDDYAGDGSYYNDLYVLLKTVILSTSNPRVFITNGFITSAFTGSTVVYPAVNEQSLTLDDYSKAVSDVSNIFNVPVLNTYKELGINKLNTATFTNVSGLSAQGQVRFSNYVSGIINSR